MTIHFGTGFSNATDTAQAAREVVVQAKNQLRQDRVDLTIIMSTIHYNPQVFLPVFRSTLGNSKIIGSSTSGIILPGRVETNGLGILTLQSDDIKFGTAAVGDLRNDGLLAAGSHLALQSLQDMGGSLRSIFFLLTDGVFENNAALLQGLQSIFGNIFPIIGSGSCDDFKFQSTFQIFNNDILCRSAIGLLMGGHLTVGIGARHGWRPLGKPRTVTKSEGGVIRTINRLPAAGLYEEFFGPEAAQFRASRLGQMAILYPLGIYVEGGEEYLLRKAVDILPDGGILCQGDVPEGSEIHIMIGNSESCKQAAVEASREALAGLLGKKPELVIIIESMARLKLLGRDTKSELLKIQETFGMSVPVFGFYSDGEICPFQTVESVKKHYYQNESLIVVAIG
jgi:hypothetical protein